MESLWAYKLGDLCDTDATGQSQQKHLGLMLSLGLSAGEDNQDTYRRCPSDLSYSSGS